MPPNVRSALGFKREGDGEEDEEEELNCLDTYPVEQFWGSPFCSYYIKGHDLGLNGWYVVEVRLMRQRWSKKSSPLVWREYVVATVAKTETRDPTGNGYLCFERSEEREPIPKTLQGLEEPDRERETEIFVDKKPYTGRPYAKDYLKYLSYVRNPGERYKYVDRVRILANPWLQRNDITVALLQLPPPEPGKAKSKTLRGNSTTKIKSKWLFVSDLVYIARELNRQRELFYIFPRTAHWLAGMMIHVVRIWTGASVKLIHRNRKQSIKIASGIDMVAWYQGLQLAVARDQSADKSTYNYDDVLKVIKLPRNYTVRALVEQYWYYCTTADVLGMFVKIETKERNYQIEMERRFRTELAEQQKKLQRAVQRIREMKEKDPRRKKVDRRVGRKEVKKTPQEKLKEIKKKRVLRYNDTVTIEGPRNSQESQKRGPKGASDASGPPIPSKPILLPKISRPTDLRPGSYHLPPTKVWRSQQKALKKADKNRKSLFRFSLEGPRSRFGLAMFKEREVDKERLKKKEEENEKAKAEKRKEKGKEKEMGKEKEKEEEKDHDKDKGKGGGREERSEQEKEKNRVKANERVKEKEKVQGKGGELARVREKGKARMVKWLGGK